MVKNSRAVPRADYKNIISARINLLDDQVFLRGLNMFEVQNASVSVLHGSLIIEVKKPEVYLNHIAVRFNGTLEEKSQYNNAEEESIRSDLRVPSAKKNGYSTSVRKIVGDSYQWDFADMHNNKNSSTISSVTSSSGIQRPPISPSSSTSLSSSQQDESFSSLDAVTSPSTTNNVGVYVYPFQFIIDSSFPESISTLYNVVKYNVSADISFSYSHKNKFYSDKNLGLQVPIQLIRCVFDDTILHNNEVIIEGSFKNLFKYQVNLTNRILYFDDSVRVNVKVTPTAEMFWKQAFYKLKVFKFFFLQSYDPDNDLGSRRKKYLLKEHQIKDSDVNKANGTIEFDLVVNFKDILSHGFVYPSFSNQERIAKFSVNHYFRSVFILEEKNFNDIELFEDLEILNNPDQHDSVKFTFDNNGESNYRRTTRDVSSADGSSSSDEDNYESNGAAAPSAVSTTSDRSVTLEELAEITSKSKYTTKYTQLTLKSPVILLGDESRTASIPPPNYEQVGKDYKITTQPDSWVDESLVLQEQKMHQQQQQQQQDKQKQWTNNAKSFLRNLTSSTKDQIDTHLKKRPRSFTDLAFYDVYSNLKSFKLHDVYSVASPTQAVPPSYNELFN